MRLTEIALSVVSPALMIPKREWLSLWRQNEYRKYLITGRTLCAAVAVLYFSHYFLVDIPAKKEPIELWAWYRFSVAGFAGVGLLVTFSSWHRGSRFYKFPALLVVAYTVHMQGQSMIWRAQIPFFYVPLFATLGAFALRLPIFGTLLAYFSILLGAYESFVCRPPETHHMVSASLVGAVALVVLRSRLKSDVESFVLEQRHLEAQRTLIEAQLALTDQLRAFLPRELFRRVEDLMRSRRRTPLQAVDEVLRPRRALAAIIYSDIRGFTAMAKTGEAALISAIIPAQKACTDAVERQGGIPRLQGDLVFAYFDDESPVKNISRAVTAAVDLHLANSNINSRQDRGENVVKRYAILSFGPVLVGNIGGSEGARDISVLGNAANLPSRIDVITKDSRLKKSLEMSPIIVTSEAAGLLMAVHGELKFEKLDLDLMELIIRDFPEEKSVYLLSLTESNLQILRRTPDVSAGESYCKKFYENAKDGKKPTFEGDAA